MDQQDLYIEQTDPSNPLRYKTASGWDQMRVVIHPVIFHHPLESIPELKSLVDLGPVPRPGDASTINAASYRRGDSGFYQTGGPTWRQVLDVGAWDNSVMVNSPGEDGEPGSPHYSDLLPLWDQGRYIPMLYSREAVEAHAARRTSTSLKLRRLLKEFVRDLAVSGTRTVSRASN
jgi:acyl-homoserine lactone acylase PvdQ